MFKHLANLTQYWDLMLAMTLRDIQVRYKQTLLGAAWAVAQPLAFMVILTSVKTLVFKESHSEGVPHQIFIYCAMVPWMFFQSSLTFATTSISGNLNLVKKIYFPREIFPLASILACIVDFLIASGIFIGMMAYYRIPITISLVWIPLFFLVEVVLVVGLGMFVAATNVFYRDIKYIVPLGVQLLFFVSPIFYSVSRVPEHLRGWYMLNPIAFVIEGFRQAILHGAGPNLQTLLLSAGTAVLVCLLSYFYFKRVEFKFADLI